MLYIDHERVTLNRFPDGTFHMNVTANTGKPQYGVQWLYQGAEELVALIYLVKTLRRNAPNCDIVLEMPYVPNARMDRIKNSDEVFTLKYFADVINSLNFTSVYVLDPHSYVSTALINNVHVMDVKKLIQKVIDATDPDLLFFPDEGAMKRYSSMAQKPYAFGIKRRDWATGKIEGLDVVGNVTDFADKKVLIVDDICSRGGTFFFAAKKLKDLGVGSICLYVTHCENTIHQGELLKGNLVDKVYTTNSIYTMTDPKIEVFDYNA